MAGRREAAEGVRSPCDLGSEIGGGKTESYLEMTGDLAPVYQEEGGQGREGLSRSERDMEFVRDTMLTAQMQGIITRIEMVAQDLIQTASEDDAQRLKRSMRAFKSALAWEMELPSRCMGGGAVQDVQQSHLLKFYQQIKKGETKK